MIQRHEAALQKNNNFEADYRQAVDLLISSEPEHLNQGIEIAEKALGAYGVLDRADWTDQPEVKELTEADRAKLKARVGEIAFLLAEIAHFHPKKADPQKSEQMHRIAETNLDEGSKPAVARQKAHLQGKATDAPDYARLRAALEKGAETSIRGRFLLACEAAAHAGRHREALTILDRVVCEDPNDFGSWFLKARCHKDLNEDTEAVAAFGTAIALRPNYARSYSERAMIHYVAGRHLDQAKADMDQALRLEPNSLDAHIDRGLVLNALGKFKDSLADLDWAIEHPNVPARVWFIRSIVRGRIGDFEGARKDREMGLQTEPAEAVSWVSRGMARLEADPSGALADFVKGEETSPRFRDALIDQAWALSEKLKKPDEAIAPLDRLLALNPEDYKAMSFKAILLARLGKMDEAVAIVRQSLQISKAPENSYRAACAMALVSAQKPALRNESLGLLASALSRGFGHDTIERDQDLESLRSTSEFKFVLGFSRLSRTLGKGQ